MSELFLEIVDFAFLAIVFLAVWHAVDYIIDSVKVFVAALRRYRDRKRK